VIYFITVNYYSSELIAQLIASLPVQRLSQASRTQRRLQSVPQISYPSEFQSTEPIGAVMGLAEDASCEACSYTLLIVNNSPDDVDVHRLSAPHIHVLEAGGNLGFGRGCNLGLAWVYERSPVALVWLINPDACLKCQDLEPVSAFFDAHSMVSILGTLVTTFSGDTWFSGGQFYPNSGAVLELNFPIDRHRSHLACDWVSGCSMILNLRNFKGCPTFDPSYFLYYEDFELCYRYHLQGHQVAITHQLEVQHRPSSITNRNAFKKTRHSTYSYLLTLQRFSPRSVLVLRLGRLFLYAIVLLLIRPSLGMGKLRGVLDYLGRSFSPHQSHPASS
jgi:N-acetylglucosaminyl-diphospho-decaprenol L-rhamnosyltransferase